MMCVWLGSLVSLCVDVIVNLVAGFLLGLLIFEGFERR